MRSHFRLRTILILRSHVTTSRSHRRTFCERRQAHRFAESIQAWYKIRPAAGSEVSARDQTAQVLVERRAVLVALARGRLAWDSPPWAQERMVPFSIP